MEKNVVGQRIAYTFHRVESCAMCGAKATEAKTLGRRLSGHQGLRPVGKPGLLTTVLRCRSCGLIFADPMPVPVDLQDHYDLPVEEYWADSPMQWSHGYFDDQIARFRTLWNGTGQPAALDVGAGAGMAMVSLANAGFETAGMEPSRSFRETAITVNGVEPDRLRLGGVDDAEYDDESFDFVTFGAVVEHLSEPAEALARAVRWTRPGGLIYMEVPSSDWLMARLLDAVYRVQGLDYTTHLSPFHVPFHLFEFTLDAFIAFAHRTGCEIAYYRRFAGLTYAPRWLAPLLVAIMNASRTGLQLEVWLRKPDP